ncbi:hypothetical protein EVAR_48412_1 [Eumeta japonica]|uniref:RNA-directed DNA polymerase from mobile element jockey n=1 Tax=Eumeta variegata TaxID=151549 RepID=A0A4C1XRC4_EUMVA|nr:hypothetical protein EVAR_48412_1 [Eumeta japonica]
MYCQLNKATSPMCLITDQAEVCHYDAHARAEVIADYLEEQFRPNPPPRQPFHQDLFLSPTALHRIVLRRSKKKANGISVAELRHLPKRAILAMNSIQRYTPQRPLPLYLEKGQSYYDLESGEVPAQTGESSAYHPAITRGEYLRACPAKKIALLPVPATGTIRVWQWPLHHATTNKSTALPSIREELWTIYGDRTPGYGEGLRQGVPHGSCLSSDLYASYTDDIATLQGHPEDWEDYVMLALYADDSVASSRRADLAAKKIEQVFKVLPEWLEKWKMAINVDHVIQMSRAAHAKLRPVLASRLPIRTKIEIYNSYIRSHLTYAAPIRRHPMTREGSASHETMPGSEPRLMPVRASARLQMNPRRDGFDDPETSLIGRSLKDESDNSRN